jgi:hypothetical protein
MMAPRRVPLRPGRSLPRNEHRVGLQAAACPAAGTLRQEADEKGATQCQHRSTPLSPTSRSPRASFCKRQPRAAETTSPLLNPVGSKLEEESILPCVRSCLLSTSFVLVCRWMIILAASSTSFGSRRLTPVSPTPRPHFVAAPSPAMQLQRVEPYHAAPCLNQRPIRSLYNVGGLATSLW